ncbi:MAG: AAA family ATPase [Oscillospiraceae bacterium]|nr:AAA family ATPase [Oscillospiraceae bacterium]
MKDICLINYAVKGIKTLDEWAELAFYKKTISKDFSIKGYNIKGVYGTNGAGKSGLITSVRILKNLITNPSYLNNPLVQKQLYALVNKKLGSLEFKTDYLIKVHTGLQLFHYEILIESDEKGTQYIKREFLSCRAATSHNGNQTRLFEVEDGNIMFLFHDNEAFPDQLSKVLIDQTKNLLTDSSLCSLFVSKILEKSSSLRAKRELALGLISLYLFGHSLCVYLDSEDEHSDFFIYDMLARAHSSEEDEEIDSLIQHKTRIENYSFQMLMPGRNNVSKTDYTAFEKQVHQLRDFLRIFKHDLKDIIIDRRIDKEVYLCDLVMNYGDYSINSEFESTGIKKLIRLFTFFKKMVEGEIVFIDELDSNLHDVYLCALLEYLMENGEGQLCFTTHNIGPMDILKKNKKSIDFLSIDHKIYSWTASGHYSPSKLYRHGMIEGSPFNVDSIDFISVFEADEEEN